MRAPRYSAFRISSRWRSPTGRSSTSASSRTCRPVSRISASSRLRTLARARASRQSGSAPSSTLSSALKVSTSMKCWCDHADAQRDRVARAADLRRLAVDRDAAAVGLVEAVEDRHQRALAGAVLADDAVHRAGRHRQVDIAVGLHRAEALADAAHLDGRLHAVAPPLSLCTAGEFSVRQAATGSPTPFSQFLFTALATPLAARTVAGERRRVPRWRLPSRVGGGRRSE